MQFKEYPQGCVLSPYLFNLFTEMIFRSLDPELGVSIGGRKVNLRYYSITFERSFLCVSESAKKVHTSARFLLQSIREMFFFIMMLCVVHFKDSIVTF